MYADEQSCQQQWTTLFSTQSQHTQQEGPDISLLDPALQKQWNHAANARLGSIVVKPKSSKKAWWICDKCPNGHQHSWYAPVYSRTNGSCCPLCMGRKVCQHNSLATKAPEVAAQWDYEKNDGTPDSVVAMSNQGLGWLCAACGHRWRATVLNRVSKNTGCPQCAEYARRKKTKHPTFAECRDPEVTALLSEWDQRRNTAENNFPDNTTLRSHKQIWWLCTKCPAGQEHSWSAPPYSRTGSIKSGCAVCAGHVACRCNSLQALYPDIAAEWDHSKNEGQPSDYVANSHHLAWWSSPQRGSWQQVITVRSANVQQQAARLVRIQQRQAFATC